MVRNRQESLVHFYPLNLNGIHPFIMMKFVFDKIAQYFDFEWEGDFYESIAFEKMLVWNPNNLDHYQEFLGTQPFQFWKRSFNLKDLVPDMSVREFLKAVQSRYNLGIYTNEKTGKIKIVKREPIAKDRTYTDITNLSGRIGPFDDLSVSGFKLSSKIEKDDKKAIEDFYVVGDGEIDLESELSGISNTFSISNAQRPYITGTVTGPWVTQSQDSDFEFRVFYYDGAFFNGSLFYPKASIHHWLNPDNTSLDYYETFAGDNGALGLYEKFWKRWLLYEQRRKVVPLEINYMLGELKHFDWELKRRFDRNNYLVKSLEFTLTNTGLSTCKAELYTMT
jgi:hypothetical protein